MRVLITNGMQTVSKTSINKLIDLGYTIRIITNNPDNIELLKNDKVELCQADLNNRKSLNGICNNVDKIIHEPGLFNSSKLECSDDVNINGTINILDEASKSLVKQFVFISSILSDCTKENLFLLSLKVIERIVRDSKLPYVIILPSLIISDVEDSEFILFLQYLIRNPFKVIKKGNDNRINLISADDMGTIITRIMELNVLQKTIDITGDSYITVNELIGMCFSILGYDKNKVTFILGWFFKKMIFWSRDYKNGKIQSAVFDVLLYQKCPPKSTVEKYCTIEKKPIINILENCINEIKGRKIL